MSIAPFQSVGVSRLLLLVLEARNTLEGSDSLDTILVRTADIVVVAGRQIIPSGLVYSTSINHFTSACKTSSRQSERERARYSADYLRIFFKIQESSAKL